MKDWDWIVAINQMAVIHGSHLAAPVMKKQKNGHIISIASAAGFATMPNMSMYNVTKAAVIAFSESIYPELQPFGIGVSVVMPTFFRTNIMQYGRGPKTAMETGGELVKRSDILPEEVALKILNAAANGTFHILHPFQSRAVWYLKRFFPSFFLWIKAYGFRHKEWVDKRLKAG
jgi:short-subunit dehydrogenase